MRSPQGAKVFMIVLCGYSLFIGALAAFVPHAFYNDFPFVTHWVDLLPPYNQHLVSDVGGLFLGFGVIFGWAAWKPERTLVLAASTGFLLMAVLHLIFHASHLDGFGTADGVAEIVGLALLLIPPVAAIWAVGAPSGTTTTTTARPLPQD